MDINTFDDVEKYKMLKYINDNFETLTKSQKAVITNYIQSLHKTFNNLKKCIIFLGDYKGDWNKQEKKFFRTYTYITYA